jgi:hypothetical protein
MTVRLSKPEYGLSLPDGDRDAAACSDELIAASQTVITGPAYPGFQLKLKKARPVKILLAFWKK